VDIISGKQKRCCFPQHLSTSADAKGNESIPALKEKGTGPGHAVVAGAYDPNFKIITWGKVASLSDEYWNGHLEGEKMPKVFEAYVVDWPEHIGTRRFMSGVSLQQLADQFYKMTGKDMEIPEAQFNSLFRCQATGGDEASVTLQKIDAAISCSSVPPSITININQTDALNGALLLSRAMTCISSRPKILLHTWSKFAECKIPHTTDLSPGSLTSTSLMRLMDIGPSIMATSTLSKPRTQLLVWLNCAGFCINPVSSKRSGIQAT
jgi:hypothetical protein